MKKKFKIDHQSGWRFFLTKIADERLPSLEKHSNKVPEVVLVKEERDEFELIQRKQNNYKTLISMISSPGTRFCRGICLDQA